jgi:SAM-dependent methyltransferase
MTLRNKEIYNTQFFNDLTSSAISSANEIVPIIIKLLNPTSVIDVGCGNGAWLSVWEKLGVSDILGVDGNYISRNQLMIKEEQFLPQDLEYGIYLNRCFDLVTCLEVAEHLKKESANNFIESLCGLGRIIIFSAAIPGQEGRNHINEQYPSYWRKLFKQNNFLAIDCIRSKIWTNDKVSWWYRQNLMIYIHQDNVNVYDDLKSKEIVSNENMIDIVHPEYFNYKSSKVSFYENDPFCKIYIKIRKIFIKIFTYSVHIVKIIKAWLKS